MPRSRTSRAQPADGPNAPFGGDASRFVPRTPFGPQGDPVFGSSAQEGDYMPKQNSGVMFQGMDMTAPAMQPPSFLDMAQDAFPSRQPETGSVLSGLRNQKEVAKPRQIVGLNGEPYTPKTKAGGPVGLN